MKSLKKERATFSEAGATLRDGRKEDVRENYHWLLVSAKNRTQRNDRLRSLCSELIVHGHYAKPAGFNPGVISSYRAMRHGVMSHMFQVWRDLPGRKVCPKDTNGYTFRLHQWTLFCGELGYLPETTLFVR